MRKVLKYFKFNLGHTKEFLVKNLVLERNKVKTLKSELGVLKDIVDKLDLESAYGDGYYEGFLHAQEIDKQEGEFLEDYKVADILKLSEQAESQSQYKASKSLEGE